MELKARTQAETDLYTQIHNSFIRNSQKVEVNHMSIDRWMDKQNVVYIPNEIIFQP